jgi:hypothetical protein
LPNPVKKRDRRVYAVPHRLPSVAGDAEPGISAAHEEACTATCFTEAPVPAMVIVTVAATLFPIFPAVIVIVTVAVSSLSVSNRCRQG